MGIIPPKILHFKKKNTEEKSRKHYSFSSSQQTDMAEHEFTE